MKKLLLKRLNFLNKIFTFSLFFNLTFYSQNLVPNPSFEQYSQCPDFDSQLQYVFEWISLLNNSADYFNACSQSEGVSVPTNGYGYGFQFAKSGNAYAGIGTYNGVGNNYREYLTVRLNNFLTSNTCYLVTYFVSKGNWQSLSTNNLALNFSSTLPTGDENILELEPHIQKFNNPVITDTLNWVEISGIYEALGNEEYITIGNFKNDNQTDTILNIIEITYYGAYYLIDDVSVIAVSDLPNGMPANAGLDKAVELSDSVFIGQEISNLNCTWRTLEGTLIEENISGIYVQPTETTTYVVEQNLCGAITYDTVTVFVNPVGLKEPLAWSASVSGIVIFPNPNNGSFEIQNPNKQQLSFELKNALGQIVYQEKIEHEKHLVNLNLSKGGALSLSQGIYFATFENASGVFEQKVVIK
jgi:hypothetical protein